MNISSLKTLYYGNSPLLNKKYFPISFFNNFLWLTDFVRGKNLFFLKLLFSYLSIIEQKEVNLDLPKLVWNEKNFLEMKLEFFLMII